jgi:acetyltransferase-like isoleucine patch superfamily enzyme
MNGSCIANGFRRRLKKILADSIFFLRNVEDGVRFQKAIAAGVLRVGRHTYGRPRVHSYRGHPGIVEIGSYCALADEIDIFVGGDHQFWVTTFPIGDLRDRQDLMKGYNQRKLEVHIGSDVWIGYGATILGGITIGDGAVIGARAVVASSVPAYAIVVGNPARVLRYRFSPAIIAELLKIRWWEWPEDRLAQAIPFLASSNVNEFVNRYRVS